MSRLISAAIVASSSRSSTGTPFVKVFSVVSVLLTLGLGVRALEKKILYVIAERTIANNEAPSQPIGVMEKNAKPWKATR